MINQQTVAKLIFLLDWENNKKIPSVIPQVEYWEGGVHRPNPTLGGREVVSDTSSAQEKTYQSKYYRKHDKQSMMKRGKKL